MSKYDTYEVRFQLSDMAGEGMTCMLLAQPSDAEVRLTEKFGERLVNCVPKLMWSKKVKRAERRKEQS